MHFLPHYVLAVLIAFTITQTVATRTPDGLPQANSNCSQRPHPYGTRHTTSDIRPGTTVAPGLEPVAEIPDELLEYWDTLTLELDAGNITSYILTGAQCNKLAWETFTTWTNTFHRNARVVNEKFVREHIPDGLTGTCLVRSKPPTPQQLSEWDRYSLEQNPRYLGPYHLNNPDVVGVLLHKKACADLPFMAVGFFRQTGGFNYWAHTRMFIGRDGQPKRRDMPGRQEVEEVVCYYSVTLLQDMSFR